MGDYQALPYYPVQGYLFTSGSSLFVEISGVTEEVSCSTIGWDPVGTYTGDPR